MYGWLYNLLCWTQKQGLSIHKLVYNYASLLIFFIPLSAIVLFRLDDQTWAIVHYLHVMYVSNRQLELRQYMSDCKTCVEHRDNAIINLFATRLVCWYYFGISVCYNIFSTFNDLLLNTCMVAANEAMLG